LGGYGRRCTRYSNSTTGSPQPANDSRANAVGNGQWKAPPGRDQSVIFLVRRIVLRNRVPLVQPVFVAQFVWLEAPVLLERERTRSALAAPIVEYPRAPCPSPSHHLPILEIVARQLAGEGGVTGIVRENGIAKVEAQDRADRLAVRRLYRGDFAVIG